MADDSTRCNFTGTMHSTTCGFTELHDTAMTVDRKRWVVGTELHARPTARSPFKHSVRIDPGRRKRIAGAVVEILADRGRAGLTYNSVARKLGLSTSSIKHHYGTIGELICGALDIAAAYEQFRIESCTTSVTWSHERMPQEVKTIVSAATAEARALARVRCDTIANPCTDTGIRSRIDQHRQFLASFLKDHVHQGDDAVALLLWDGLTLESLDTPAER